MNTDLLISFVGIAGVILGALISLITQIVTTKINLKNEKKKILFQMEIDKLSNLETKIGKLVEVATSYSSYLKDEKFRSEIAYLTYTSGEYLKIKSLCQLIRDIQNRIFILLDQEKKHENPLETRKEIDKIADKIFTEIKKYKTELIKQ